MDLNTTPAMAAPPGEVSNFHPGITEIQMKFITVYAGTLARATVCLALQIWTRARIVRGIWADDCTFVSDHLWNVSLAQLVKYAEVNVSMFSHQ